MQMYVVVGMILPVLIEVGIVEVKLLVKTVMFIKKTMGNHYSVKPYSDAELEPT